MSKEFFDAVKAIEAEKGIPAEYLYEKISLGLARRDSRRTGCRR